MDKDILKTTKRELKDVKSELNAHRYVLRFYEAYNPIKLRRIPLIKSSSPKSEHGTVLSALSDIHCEHKITLAQTNYANKYTPTICSQRLYNYANNLIKLVKMNRKDITLDTLLLALLGDNMHGFIHDEYIRTNYMTPIEASMFITDEFRKVLDFILNYGEFKRIVIICKIGNHSRITEKVYSDEEAIHSYEWGVYQTLRKMYPIIEWIIDESYFTYCNVYSKVLRFHHGHGFKYMGGIGGITVPFMRYIAKVNRQKSADMDVIGHWHGRNFSAIDGFIINDSVCGADPYSIRKGFPIVPPTQLFQIIDQKRGFTVNAPITLT